MPKLLTALALVCCLHAAGQKKDTLVRYFNTELEPVKKKEAVVVGVVIKDAFGWNAMVYSDSLKVIMRGRYLDNDCKVKDGWFIYYNPNGERYLAGKYVKNERNDLWQTWYPGGQVKDSIYFLDDMANGPCRRYFASGMMESSGFYKLSRPDSSWFWYHENGQHATKEKYKNGLLNSLECFDSTGSPAGTNCAINRPPAIKGRYGGIEKFLEDSLRNFDKLKLEYTRLVEFQLTIDRTGTMGEPVFFQIDEPLLTTEIKNALKLIPGWYPAVSHNRNTDHIYRLRVQFFPDSQGVRVIDMKNTYWGLAY